MKKDDIALLKDLLIEHEGIRLFPYKCTSGRLTIGIGRNIEQKGISKDEAIYLLDNDIAETIELCGKLPYWDGLDSIRQVVIADMVFNIGFGAFTNFRLLNDAMNRKGYDDAAHEMRNSKWFTQVGQRAVQLSHAMQYGVIQ